MSKKGKLDFIYKILESKTDLKKQTEIHFLEPVAF